MRCFKLVILASVALLPFSTAVFAVDAYDYSTGTTQNAGTYDNGYNAGYNNSYSNGYDWQGGYAGLTVGYGWASFGTNRAGFIDDSAFNWGGFAGYNFQAGNVVFGVEGDLGYAWNKGKKNVFKAEQGFEGSFRGRLGYSFGQWMPYATAGIAGARTKVDSNIAGGSTKTRFGWTAGLGLETMLTQNIIGRIEYRHSDFDKKNYNLDMLSLKSDLSRNDLKVGIGYKF